MQELWGLSPANDLLCYILHATQYSSGRFFDTVTISVDILTGKTRAHLSWSCICDMLPCRPPNHLFNVREQKL